MKRYKPVIGFLLLLVFLIALYLLWMAFSWSSNVKDHVPPSSSDSLISISNQ